MTLEQFALAVVAYCVTLEANVVSWKRTVHHSAMLCGRHNASHALGLGADVIYDRPQPLALRHRIAHELELSIIETPGYDHLEPLSWTRRSNGDA